MEDKNRKRPRFPGTDRRQFLRIVAMSGIAGVMMKAGWDTLAELETISETRLLMGTILNLTVVSSRGVNGQEAVEACLSRMAELEGILSRFRSDSQLSLLNNSGYLDDADQSFLELLTLSDQFSRRSGGAFDVTVMPLIDLYQSTYAAGKKGPSERDIGHALALVDYDQIEIEGRKVRLAQRGMAVTLDGIAKGYIVDEGVDELRRRGFVDVMVEAGGDLMALGERRPGDAWQVGIKSPRASRPGLIASMAVQNRAVATSGDYMQAFTPDFRQHHIIDPRSGRSSDELSSVTVIAPSTAVADALATTAMVLGVRGGSHLVEALPGCEAMLITKELEAIRTTGFDA